MQPGDLLFYGAVPERRAGAQATIDLGVQAVALQQAAKGLLALLRPAIGLCFRQAEAGKARQPGLDQVLVGRLDQGVIVSRHIRNALRVGTLILIGASDCHHRQFDPGQCLADQRVIEIGNDPVPLPALDAFQATEEILLQEQVPGHPGAAEIVADAADDAAVIDLAAVEQQRDTVNGRYGLHCFYADSISTTPWATD